MSQTRQDPRFPGAQRPGVTEQGRGGRGGSLPSAARETHWLPTMNDSLEGRMADLTAQVFGPSLSPWRSHSSLPSRWRAGAGSGPPLCKSKKTTPLPSPCTVQPILVYVLMVDFRCQLDWAKGCPDGWENLISGCVCEGVPRRARESVG